MNQETENLTTQGIQIKVVKKVCGKCKRELPSKDFWGSRSSKDGLQGACKDCQLGTPLGSHTTNTTMVAPVKTVEPVVETIKVGGPAYQKRVRPSRAHPIGSGRRKECRKCKYHMTSINDDPCINAAAIADAENQVKVCPYKE